MVKQTLHTKNQLRTPPFKSAQWHRAGNFPAGNHSVAREEHHALLHLCCHMSLSVSAVYKNTGYWPLHFQRGNPSATNKQNPGDLKCTRTFLCLTWFPLKIFLYINDLPTSTFQKCISDYFFPWGLMSKIWCRWSLVLPDHNLAWDHECVHACMWDRLCATGSATPTSLGLLLVGLSGLLLRLLPGSHGHHFGYQLVRCIGVVVLHGH